MPTSPLPPHRPRVAVLGCGQWGKNHVRVFHRLGALAALHDADPAGAVAQAERHGVPARTLRDILDDPGIDAVVVATPAATHHAIAREALLAGKHVLVEKPLALDVGAAEDLAGLAAAGGRTLMVGHLLQYHPAFAALRTLVETGEIGRLLHVASSRLNLGRIRSEENALWSLAPHDVSMILALAGEPPASVLATGFAGLREGVADLATVRIRFASGLFAQLSVSWLHPVKEHRLVAVGERGSAILDDGLPWPSKLTLHPHAIDLEASPPTARRGDARAVPVAEREPLDLECAHFLDCVAGGRRPRTDAPEAIAVLKVLQAAQRSMEEGEEVVLDGRAGPAAPAMPGVQVHESAYVDEPCSIGPGTRIWHFSHILPRVTIGRDVTIGQNVSIGPDVRVADHCKIQNNVSIYQGVTLEEGVFCGPSCVFTNVLTPRAEIERKDEFRPTRVGRGATIGANATIVCGHALGRWCLVAAGAVVTSDVPDFALVAGVPARRVGWVGHAGERLDADLTCPRSGRRYRLAGPDLLEEITECPTPTA